MADEVVKVLDNIDRIPPNILEVYRKAIEEEKKGKDNLFHRNPKL
tara:strand:+ start:466 stop:600 length:135 start_codon:yes stop_codon:yes gene_type:complete